MTTNSEPTTEYALRMVWADGYERFYPYPDQAAAEKRRKELCGIVVCAGHEVVARTVTAWMPVSAPVIPGGQRDNTE